MTEPENVVIVGASLAGLRTAEALRERGYTGRLTMIGAEPHAPYDRPPLSKQVLAGWVSPAATALPRQRAIAATWRLGTAATGLDRAARQVLIGQEAVSYDRLVIATGTRNRIWPQAEGSALSGVHGLRTREDAAALVAALDAGPARVLVIGAGFTGVEVASACRARGLAVTMVERHPTPLMPAFGAVIGGYLGQLHRDAGVDLRCGVTVTSLLHDAGGRAGGATLSDGETIVANVVVACLGAVRNVEWLLDAGLDASAAGCVCDASGTARDAAGDPVPDIFVCGDVARFRHSLAAGAMVALEHWGNAVDQAAVVAANILQPGSVRNDTSMPRFWSASFGIGLKVSGLPSYGDSMVIAQGSLASGRFVAVYGRAGRMVGVVAANQARWLSYYERQLSLGAAFPPAFRVVDQPIAATPEPAGFPQAAA